MHFHMDDFGGKMLARSLKNIWTDEKLVYLCSAKDKMVSNLTTMLQCCLSSAQWWGFGLSLLSVLLLPVWAFYTSICHVNTCAYIRGEGAGGSHGLGQIWRCGLVPTGYRPSYFVLEGGKGVGRSIRESQAPLLCRSTPRAPAEDWWSVRAQSCLPDRSAVPSQRSSTPQQCFSCTHALFFSFSMTMLDKYKFTQMVIYADIHCNWIASF